VAKARRAFPNTSEGRKLASQASVTKAIGSPDLAGGGKLQPASLPKPKKPKPKKDDEDEEKLIKSLYVPIIKATKERKTITGVVLEPDTVDAHGDIIPDSVILDAAEDFLANINVQTTLGLMHKDFKQPLQLVQSFVVSDSDVTINNVLVKRGSWVIVVRVLSDKIWQDVKDGKLTGFSIGGKAKVKNLSPQAA
jgi:hypothetical protein